MELNVQKYLRNGKTINDLTNYFGIIVKEYNSLVILSYNQIDSPKSHPIVMECRGLVLEKDSWNIVCYPFKRFFNHNEVLEITKTFDYNNSVCLEKLDGSLISLFYYNNKWYMSTRSMIENNSKIGFNDITFKTLFYNIIKNKYPYFWNNLNNNFTYVFELTAPENRIVTIYEKQDITLLMARNKHKEVNIEELKHIANKLNIKIPKIYSFKNKNDIFELINKLKTLEEGFVAVNYNQFDDDGISFKRIKLKNPSYIAMHHLKDSSGKSMRSLLRLVMKNEDDEFLKVNPEQGETES